MQMDNEEKSVPLIDSEAVVLEHGGVSNNKRSPFPTRELVLRGYRSHVVLTFIKWFLVIATGGIVGLLLLWNVRFRYFFHIKCSQTEAEVFLMYSESKSEWVIAPVQLQYGRACFEFEGNRYYWDGNKYVEYVERITWTHHDIVSRTEGLGGEELSDSYRVRVGPNIIDIPITPLIEDVLFAFFGPVQVYQYFCCTVWYIHGYPGFASMLMVSLLVSTSLVIYNNRKSREHLRAMAMHSIQMDVLRNGKWNTVSSADLIPGDFVQIPKDDSFKCPCDLVLVSGTALVDESFLTGESLPVVKTQPEDDKSIIFDAERDKRNCIYSSTTVMSCTPGAGQQDVIALVARTGFRTTKGLLVKAILHTKPYTYPYQTQSFVFLMMLLGLGFVLFWVSLYIWGVFDPNKGLQTKEQILYAFEAIVCLVPPFLPIIFDITLLTSAKNLESVTIYSTSPSRVPVAGKVKIMCFDKTGTLTKTDLDMIGVVPAIHLSEMAQPIPVKSLPEEELLIHGMATCHTLAGIGNIIDISDTTAPPTPSYSGPRLDIQMFEATGWKYIQAFPPHVISPKNEVIEIIKRFDFDNNIQRMSVLTRKKDGSHVVFVKGSGESIKSCCDPDTIPPNFEQILKYFSRDGCYVIGLATRSFPPVNKKELSDLIRSDLDRDLTFLGLLLLRNELKPDSREAIYHIKQGRIRPVMVTGDNLFTAYYIAKQCGIVFPQNYNCYCGTFDEKEHRVIFRELTLHNKILDPYNWKVTYEGRNEGVDPSQINIGVDNRAYSELLSKGDVKLLVNHIQIFARMRPLQKQDIIDLMMENGEIVGMCGDGANDCAALSHAHFGVALSAAEASLIAPFTAQSLSACACVDLIKEGRSCLASSFAAFKLTLFHAIVVNTTAMFIGFTFGSDLSQGEYLVTDFIFFFIPVFFIVRTKPADYLRGNPPTSKIFGPTTMLSFLSMVAVSWIAEGVSIQLLKQQPWFVAHTVGTIAKYNIVETTILFLVSVFVLGGCGIAVSFGATWRQPIWKNYGLIVIWIIQIGTLIFMYTVPHDPSMSTIAELMEMIPVPGGFRITIAVLSGGVALLIILWEKYVIIGPIGNYCRVKTGRGRPQATYNPIWDNKI